MAGTSPAMTGEGPAPRPLILRPARPGSNNGRQSQEEALADELRDILHNSVKEKLARDEVVASMTVRLTRSIEIARIAATAGFDTLYVDVEHNSFSIDAVSQICIAAMQCGITPLVRVPANTPEFICRLLDGGALGVIAPHVRSAAEARDIVRYARFTPLGERGAGGALPHYHY